ncbi:MAG: DMT family transporter [Clostridia bacterium]|nr:DMT family transporter [Clostridia bacterium]
MKQENKSLIFLNSSVFLFGLAGIFAKWINIPALGITFGRVFFSSISLLVYLIATRQKILTDSRKDFLKLVFCGIILAVHWWSFLGSVQKSSVATGTITFSSFPLFVTVFEAILGRRKIRLNDLIFATSIIVGVAVTCPSFSVSSDDMQGFSLGLISAVSYAILTLCNKNFTGRINESKISFYEQSSAMIFLLPIVLLNPFPVTVKDISLLVLLGVFTTALAHTMFISSLKNVSASVAGVCSSMETVYGILFAFVLLGEVPYVREIIGGLIIIITVTIRQYTIKTE